MKKKLMIQDWPRMGESSRHLGGLTNGYRRARGSARGVGSLSDKTAEGAEDAEDEEGIHSESRAADAEHSFVMTVPLALKEFLGVVLELQLQEIVELRIASFNLVLRREAMISKVVASSVPNP